MINDIVSSNPDLMGGAVVFKGTRVPVETLFDNLEAGVSINEFVLDFPAVSKVQVEQLLDLTAKMFSSGRYRQLYESVA